MIRKSLVLAFCSFLVLPLIGQKKALDHSVYDDWKSITNTSISNDAKYAINIVKAQEGDDYVLVNNLQTQKQLIIPRGYKYKLIPNEKFAIVQIKAPFSQLREEKIKKLDKEKMSKDTLAIINLENLSLTKIANVKNFKIGKDTAYHVVYSLDNTIKLKNKKDIKPYTLVYQNIKNSKCDSLQNVIEYTISNNGKALLANIRPEVKKMKKGEKQENLPNQVIVVDLLSNQKDTISEGKKIYKHLCLSESGHKLAFLASDDSLKQEIKDFQLYYFLDGTKVINVVDKNKAGIPNKWTVSEFYKPQFSKNEKRLLLGTAPIKLAKDTTIPDFEKAQLDIWHWQEPEIQPKQLVSLKKTEEQTFLAYVNLENNKFTQLATEEIPNVYIADHNNSQFAIGTSQLPYRFEMQWDITARTTYDIWKFDLSDGSNQKIKTKLHGRWRLSPQGNYLAWYDVKDRQYYSYALKTDKELCLTKDLNVNFWDEKYDMPSVPDAYGFGAWLEDDEAFLVYDAYDIWKLDTDGNKTPINITNGVGRKNKYTFRYLKTDIESKFIKKNEEILLSVFDYATKNNGFYKLDKKSKLIPLRLEAYSFTNPIKTRNKNFYLFTKANFSTSPDLYITSSDWKTEKKLSNINPQMKDYNWGTNELVTWTTFSGKKAQGVLYKPENFDPNKKYPLISYFYERHSENMHRYMPPIPSRSIINIPYFCSNGYIVFDPDIHYTDGHPGESAYDYIVSGVEAMAENSWIDRDNMAIQGQSWGGYQVSYLVTRTNIFKAAGAGAPVSNMFSAYGGIRWGTGNSRQYQYEQTQSRIGATIWEAPEFYKENSPIFGADKVQTPLLIMHNDKDGAVPWYQGIEYFMALRRLGKPVWMLQYNGEEHNLTQRKNCKDLAIRLQQFFDHYLKGSPMPKWMKTGVPATDKGKDYGFDFK